jgi:hypothetical protein
MKRYVDLDSTLAVYNEWEGSTNIGQPVLRMLDKVKRWLKQGDQVVVFTTRLRCKELHYLANEDVPEIRQAIEEWCVKWLGQKLEVTFEKKFFDKCYDDRVEHIIPNTGYTREEFMLAELQKIRNYYGAKVALDWAMMYLNETIKEQI